jgi:hypothetical protein
VRICGLHLLLAVALLAASPAAAILIDSGDGTGNVTAPPNDPGWENVGRAGLNAVYVGYGWMLTAAHVSLAGGQALLAGKLYPIAAPSIVVFAQDANNDADLQAFRIDPWPRHLPLLPIRQQTPGLDTPVVMIGTAFPRGPATRWRGIDGYEWDIVAGPKRWGTNDIGGVVSQGSPPTNAITLDINGRPTEVLVTDFTEGTGGDECAVTLGDSGGALFVDEAGSWELAGIHVARGSFPDQPAETTLYENLSYSVDLAAYRDAVLAVVRPCADGVDRDGDGDADFPEDTGCTWPGDMSEQPDCSDGLDNDFDGTTDLLDPDCASGAGALEEPDQDGDLVPDDEDNCLVVANADQLDTNGDGYGNACDADYDDDGTVGTSDFLALGAAFGTTSGQPGYDADIDVDGDGVIGASEFLLFGSGFGTPPGPSGFSCAGTPICP